MRELFSLYGPVGIQSFGLFIVIGILIFTFLFLQDPRRKNLISSEQYYNGLSAAIIVGFLGGRLLYVATSDEPISFGQIFAFWEGGYSLLGGIVALTIFIPWYLKAHNIPILPLLDLVSIYAPLLQSISRIGCFFAGCCFGVVTHAPWGIHQSCSTQLIHPTQLYSAGILFAIFLFLYFLGQRLFPRVGQTTCAYLTLMSGERFFVDFWRGDREFIALSQHLSVAQLIAAVLMIVGIGGFIYFTFRKTARKS